MDTDNSMICSVPECDRERMVKFDMCRPHRRREQRGAPLNSPIIARGARPTCSVEGCDLQHYGKTYCRRHYVRHYHGKPLEGKFVVKLSGNWSDWFVNPYGYVGRSRRVDGKQEHQRQHRVVMEEMIGRPLLPKETVHHKNGVRHDNRPENLELWSSSQPAGQRVEDKLAWAREIIELYG